jgi:ubiquitin C-terminal hydrolase
MTMPEELKKFEGVCDQGVGNRQECRYARRGIVNVANNCYVSVIVQALLPCSALMWIFRQCNATDRTRPFHACMLSLAKQFHGVQNVSGPVEALAMQQVKDVVSRWQKLGAQQDAGEFLFYLLNGLHEECKWCLPEPEVTEEAKDGGEDGAGGWAHLVKTSKRREETRSAGLREDSPIFRVFGGILRSTVREKSSAKADSVTQEPFNHLDLDISHDSVKSVQAALAAFCRPEEVNDGMALRRVQFKVLPKVLVVCLKRFAFRGKAQKITKSVAYDQRLRLDPSWVAEDAGTPPDYFLTALICHHGEMVHKGHYTTMVRYNNEWYLYDDTNVVKMEPREVANQQATAYLLIYQTPSAVDFRP